MAPLRGPRCGPFPFFGLSRALETVNRPILGALFPGRQRCLPLKSWRPKGGIAAASTKPAAAHEPQSLHPAGAGQNPATLNQDLAPRREEDGDEGQIRFGLHAESEWRQARTRLAHCGPAGRSAGFRRAVRGTRGKPLRMDQGTLESRRGKRCGRDRLEGWNLCR